MQPATVLHAECVCAVLCRYRRGLLSACIPSQLLGLWTVEEFQKHVSGSPEVPIDKMKAQTRFSVRSPPVLPLALDLDLSAAYAFPLPSAPVFSQGDGPTDMFWELMERFSHEERGLVLKFATGRIRYVAPCSDIDRLLLGGCVRSYTRPVLQAPG